MSDECREAFEKLLGEPNLNRLNDGYLNIHIQNQWQGWQACWNRNTPTADNAGLVAKAIEASLLKQAPIEKLNEKSWTLKKDAVWNIDCTSIAKAAIAAMNKPPANKDET